MTLSFCSQSYRARKYPRCQYKELSPYKVHKPLQCVSLVVM